MTEMRDLMTPQEANLTFPVLVLTQNLETYSAPDLRNLARWTKSAVENLGTVIGMTLVDAGKKQFVIRDVRVIGEWKSFPPAKIRRFLKWRVDYEVTLSLERTPRMTFKEIKKFVHNCIVDKPEFYLLNYSPENDEPENAEAIAATDDVDSLPGVLKELAAMRSFEDVLYQFAGDTLDTYDGPIDINHYR
jgi:hypothetical protein